MEFADMPPEMHCKIFSYLTETELEAYVKPICPEWKAVVDDPIFRRNIVFDGQEETQDEIIQEINNSYLVRNLSISNMKNWDWINHSPRLDVLTRLSFKSCLILPSTLLHIVQLSPSVQRIDLLNCPTINIEVISEMVRWKSLQNICLDFPTNCDGNECLNIISENCDNLQQIGISWSFKRISDKSLLHLIRHCGANLKKLDLNCSQLTTNSFSEISRSTKLTELTIYMAPNITDVDLMTLKNLKCLKILALTGGNKLTAKGFQRFFREADFPRLHTLLIGKCNNFSNKSARPIGISCPALTDLLLACCPNVSDNGVRAIVNRSHKMKRMYMGSLNQLTGLWMDDISSKLPGLRELHFRNCYNIELEILERTSDDNPNLKLTDVYITDSEENIIF